MTHGVRWSLIRRQFVRQRCEAPPRVLVVEASMAFRIGGSHGRCLMLCVQAAYMAEGSWLEARFLASLLLLGGRLYQLCVSMYCRWWF
jgi:hypothetical protein